MLLFINLFQLEKLSCEIIFEAVKWDVRNASVFYLIHTVSLGPGLKECEWFMIRLKIWNLLLFLRSNCQSQIEVLKAVFCHKALKNKTLYPILYRLDLPLLNVKYKPSTDYTWRGAWGDMLFYKGSSTWFKSVSQSPGFLAQESICIECNGWSSETTICFILPLLCKRIQGRLERKCDIHHPHGRMHTHSFNHPMIFFHLTKAKLFNAKDWITSQETSFGTSFINVTVRCSSIWCLSCFMGNAIRW